VLRRVCAPTPLTPLTTAWELLQAAASTVTPDRVIMAGGKHSQLSTGLAVSIVMDSTLTRRHAAFKVRGHVVILVLPM